jgi:hypothetical protein
MGRAPEIFKSLSGETRKLYFHFHGDSILNVALVEPGGRQISVSIGRKEYRLERNSRAPAR